jgi:hypothetical protein
MTNYTAKPQSFANALRSRRGEAATSCFIVAEGADLGGFFIRSDAAVNARGYRMPGPNWITSRKRTRRTKSAFLVNEELARSLQDLAKSLFKKRVRRSLGAANGDELPGTSVPPGSSFYSR